MADGAQTKKDSNVLHINFRALFEIFSIDFRRKIGFLEKAR